MTWREDNPDACPRCLGCGQLANSEDREPWSAWAELPPGSDLAVRMGMVKPIPCDQCGGSGKATSADESQQDEKEIGSAILDVIAESDWLRRHESAVAAKVLVSIQEHNVVDAATVARIRDEWGIDDEVLAGAR